MFGSCDWPWLRKAWTRHNNSSPRPAKSPLGRPFVLLLIIAIAVLVPPRDVFGQTEANTLLVSSYDEIENNGQSDTNNKGPEEQLQFRHSPIPPNVSNKMVDGGAVSKVRKDVG